MWPVIIISIVVLIYWKLSEHYKFWREKGVPHGRPFYVLGDFADGVFKKSSFVDILQKIYKKHAPARYCGLFQLLTPTLMLRDVDLIKRVAIKDFDHFVDRKPLVPENSDVLWSKNLVSLRGQNWKDMRAALSPSFTSSKMRMMFSLISKCSENVSEYFSKSSSKGETITIEVKDLTTRFANDVIASTAFGIECDSLSNKENEFYLMGKEATNFTGFRIACKFLLAGIFPSLFRMLSLELFTSKVSKFFRKIIKDTIKSREENHVVRPDMIHLLMEARKGKSKLEGETSTSEAGFATTEEFLPQQEQKSRLTDDDITAQALIFFFAGFETVSTSISFLVYELATNPDVQEKLIKEIDATRETCGNSLTMEALLKMKYLDMVVSESLRKWPPAIAVDRMCVDSYKIEPETPQENVLELKKNDVIWIPIYSIHHDDQYYENPDVFDPERFSDENKAKIKPCTYMPFGIGPRNCIGSRFALIEMKTLIFHILSSFEIVPVARTQIPLKISMAQFNLTPEGGIWVGLEPRRVQTSIL